MIDTDFHEMDSKYRLKLGEFNNLSDKDKKKLVQLMARIMERAYRRAVQQTLHLQESDLIDDWIIASPYEYRYEKSLSTSIGLDGYQTSSIGRLMIEENLEDIGLRIDEK